MVYIMFWVVTCVLSVLWRVSIVTLSVLVVVSVCRLVLADADLTLLTYEQFGKKTGSLRGRVVWITGASSGIGEQLSYVLARAGCQLVLTARRHGELRRVRDACVQIRRESTGKTDSDDDFLVVPLDVLDTHKHEAAFAEVLEHFGHLDTLVNNAARSQSAWIRDTPIAVDREIIDLVVLAQLSLTKTVLPHFIERRGGHLVVTSSGAGKLGVPYSATYSLGKHALHGFFEALRMEHASDNIDVTMLCPGPVHTDIRKHSFTAVQGEVYGSMYGAGEKRMTAERCAHLSGVAIANTLAEVWMSPHPALLFMYIE